MNQPSLEPHREFLRQVLVDDEPYSVTRIRELAMGRNYPALLQLTEALIWNYRIHDFLDEVEHWIDCKPAWSGRRWKNLLQPKPPPKDSFLKKMIERVKHWLEILPYIRRACEEVLTGKTNHENGARHS